MTKWLFTLILVSAPAFAESDLDCRHVLPPLQQAAKDSLALCVRNSPQEIQSSTFSSEAYEAANSSTILQHSARNQLAWANRPNISRSEAATLEADSHKTDAERHQVLYTACVNLRRKIDGLYQHAKVKCKAELAASEAQVGGSYDQVLKLLSRSVQESRKAIETSRVAEQRTREIAGATAAAP